MTLRVLIADDDKDARFLWKVVSREFGLDVTEATTGREALIELEKDTQFALVILDVMMPLVTGYEVLREMRATDSRKATPVIVSTANRTTQGLGEITVDEKTFFVNKASGIENMRRGIARALGQEL
ncbi:MAG: response regulator [Acidobacteriota bacterium]